MDKLLKVILFLDGNVNVKYDGQQIVNVFSCFVFVRISLAKEKVRIGKLKVR